MKHLLCFSVFAVNVAVVGKVKPQFSATSMDEGVHRARDDCLGAHYTSDSVVPHVCDYIFIS